VSTPSEDACAQTGRGTCRSGEQTVVVRHFWAGEMGSEAIDPGQDPRGAPDIAPLWTILDLTPAGRGENWYPKLDY
jgi:predicted dithiol-disulfide oxidoreductase (DUF899 family)